MAYGGSFAWFEREESLRQRGLGRLDFLRRFPEGTEGLDELAALLEIARREPSRERLTQGRQLLGRLQQRAPDAEPPVPRLFISHRRADVEPARRVALLAKQAGFEYWLDVEDPNLGAFGLAPSPQGQALVVAAVIEIALINSSHLLAVITRNSFGANPSAWIPYEYGRVKDDTVYCDRTSCWLAGDVAAKPLPEYLHLGHKHRTETEISAWLDGYSAQCGLPPGRGVAFSDPVLVDTEPLP